VYCSAAGFYSAHGLTLLSAHTHSVRRQDRETRKPLNDHTEYCALVNLSALIARFEITLGEAATRYLCHVQAFHSVNSLQHSIMIENLSQHFKILG
jgi:hypothetical protein